MGLYSQLGSGIPRCLFGPRCSPDLSSRQVCPNPVLSYFFICTWIVLRASLNERDLLPLCPQYIYCPVQFMRTRNTEAISVKGKPESRLESNHRTSVTINWLGTSGGIRRRIGSRDITLPSLDEDRQHLTSTSVVVLLSLHSNFTQYNLQDYNFWTRDFNLSSVYSVSTLIF